MNITLDLDMLANVCAMPELEFSKYAPLIRSETDPESYYFYHDRGAKILAVAHLDSVITPDENWTFELARLGENKAKKTFLWNAQLDDRLGAYIILELLPTLIGEDAFDILLTTNEEIGRSTAGEFVLPAGKEYNWIFQFDRRGVDAVLYNYEDTEWRGTVAEFFTIGIGSFSDIVRLTGLGVKALNIGTGYYNEHQHSHHMIIEDCVSQVAKFVRFWKEHKDTRFPHVPATYSYAHMGTTWSYKKGTTYGWRDDDDAWEKALVTSSKPTHNPPLGISRNVYNSLFDEEDLADWVDDKDSECFVFACTLSTNVLREFSLYINDKGEKACRCSRCTDAIKLDYLLWSSDGERFCSFCTRHEKTYDKNLSMDMPEIAKLTYIGPFSDVIPKYIDLIKKGGTILLVNTDGIPSIMGLELTEKKGEYAIARTGGSDDKRYPKDEEEKSADEEIDPSARIFSWAGGVEPCDICGLTQFVVDLIKVPSVDKNYELICQYCYETIYGSDSG